MIHNKLRNRILSLVLAFVMVLGMMPLSSLTAVAADTTTEIKSIMLGTSHITGGQASNIYFGNYQQASLGSTQPTTGTEGVNWIQSSTATENGQGPYYSISPIKWRVLSNDGSNLFLLSDRNLDVVQYHTEFEAVTWETSTIRSWLNGYGAASNQNSVDYASDNFINAAFGAAEKGAIADTTVVNDDNSTTGIEGGNNTTDKIFLLSIAEVSNKSYFTNDKSRQALSTAYAYGGGKTGSTGQRNGSQPYYWWLRSPGESTKDAAKVYEDGGVDKYYGSQVHMQIYSVRPAFNLDLSSVLFTSAARGGKPTGTGLTATTAYTGNEYKLTLKDDTRKFALTDTSAKTTHSGDVLSLGYTGATTGANEYISAMIVDANGAVIYYGQLAQVASVNGTVRFTIPADLTAGNYTLKLFNEQMNGDYKTDYSSAFADVSLTVHSSFNDGFCTICGAYEPAPLTDGVYQISNVGQLYWFAELVNGGSTDADAIVTANIVIPTTVSKGGTVADWTPIGNNTNKYTGTFDGNGHTISGLYKSGSHADYLGLFGYVGSGGIVRKVSVVNAHLDGQSGSYLGLITSFNEGTIENCSATGAGVSGATFGGLVGHNIGTGRVVNCYADVTLNGSSSHGLLIGINEGTVENSYCKDRGPYAADAFYKQNGTVDDKSGIMTADQFASGEVAFLLQGEQATHVWGQTIGSDSYPVLGGAKVYAIYTSCANDAAATTYTNTEPAGKPHIFNENGICEAVEGERHYQPAVLNADGYYEIANAGNLFWFAQQVNDGKNTINAVLTANIDIITLPWEAMGQQDTPYIGTFDGRGYIISNLSRDTGLDEGTRASFVYYLGEGGCIKNVTFDCADVFTQGHANANASAVVALRNSGTIECVVVTNSRVQLGAYAYLAGIAGVNESSGVIKNCAVLNTTLTRRFSGYDKPSGGIVYKNLGTVEGCYTYGCSYSTANESNGGVLVEGNAPVNSYYYTASTVAASEYAKTTEQFASGEVTYLLNGGVTDGSQVWYQALEQGLPAFVGETVYQNTCEGNIFYATTDIDYESHDLGDDFRCRVCGNYDAPEQDANGVYQIATPSNLFWFAEEVNKGNTNIDAVLTNDIDLNSVQWMPIGNEANPFMGTFDGQNYKIENLYIRATEGGNYGVFGYLVDGTVKNFSVSGNAVIELSVQEAVNYGVIGAAAARNAHTYVTNVHSTVTMEIKDSFDKNSIAGIVGYAEGKNTMTYYRLTIDGCSFGGSLNFGSAYVDAGGGIAGYVNYNGAVTIQNCLYNGTITSEYEGAQAVGGIMGYNRGNNMYIKNCLSIGTLKLKNTGYAGAVAGRYLILNKYIVTYNNKNNYYTGSLPAFSNTTDESIANYDKDIVDYAEYKDSVAASVTDTQLASGEVTYLLNGGVTDGSQVWYQTCGQGLPAFSGQTVYQVSVTYCDGTSTTAYSNVNENVTDAHKYEAPTFVWTSDYAECRAVFTCLVCTAPNIVTCTVTTDTTDPAKTVYTASAILNGVTYTDTKEVVAKVASVTITWTEMSFTYHKGTWNTETLTWDGGGWVADDGCGTVTVENTGTVDVNAEFTVNITNEAYDGDSVGFTADGTALTDNKLNIPAGESKTVSVTLTGDEPTAYIEDKKTIGQITIVLSTE